MTVEYSKMQGLGNDFIVFRGPVNITGEQTVKLCDRRSNIGADGVIVITQLEANSVKMDYWNADGSVAEMCGNGLRCVARYAVDKNLVKPGKFIVQTHAGPLEVICTDASEVEAQIGLVKVDSEPITLQEIPFYIANVGNPHAITFVEGIDDAPVKAVGSLVENDEHFPNKTNVEFVEIIKKSYMKLRVWERGVGETLACGTGMVAAAIVANHLDKVDLPVEVEVRGGIAEIWLDSEGYARMRAPAEITYTAQIEI